MLTFTLNDGNRIPWLGYGTGTALFGRDATDAVRMAIDNGVVHIDGAQMYSNEESLGTGIKKSGRPRTDLYVVTKLHGAGPVRAKLEESLAKLGLDYVDLFLIHSPAPSDKEGKLKDLWKQMEEVTKLGLAKSIGVSNFRVEDMEVILDGAKIIPSINQIELHPYVWKAAEPIVKFAEKHGIRIASYGGQAPVVRVLGGPLDDVLSRIRTGVERTYRRPVTTGQLLTKWLLQKGVVVVTTTSKTSRLKEFIESERLPDLTSEDMAEIEEVGSTLHKRVYMKHVFGE